MSTVSDVIKKGVFEVTNREANTVAQEIIGLIPGDRPMPKWADFSGPYRTWLMACLEVATYNAALAEVRKVLEGK
jgi:hypothetical protein